MKICVLGLGVIGTVYGYAFYKAGCEVCHLMRAGKRADAPKEISVHLLDGRYNNKGEEKEDIYSVEPAKNDATYDFILISVGGGKLKSAVETVKNNRIKGTIIIFCNFWDDRKTIEQIVGEYPYIIAFPTAGGRLENDRLDCVLFDHVMLDSEKKCNALNYREWVTALCFADIKTEIPHDMVEWIWIHMAINAGVTSTAAKNGIISDPKELALDLMSDSKSLSQAVKTIRETLKVVEARGVPLSLYKREILPYKIPAGIAGVLMKRMFASNELTRRIMTLHNDIPDILYGCKSVYNTANQFRLDLPLFYKNIAQIDAGSTNKAGLSAKGEKSHNLQDK